MTIGTLFLVVVRLSYITPGFNPVLRNGPKSV